MKRSEEIAEQLEFKCSYNNAVTRRADFDKKRASEIIARETGCDEPERWPRCKCGGYLSWTHQKFGGLAGVSLDCINCIECGSRVFRENPDSALAVFRAANKEQPAKDVPHA